MSTFEEIKKGIPDQITIPTALEKLCHWTDLNGYPISGYFELNADDGETMRYWLGFEDLSNRFGIFGIGPDGSLYSFWIDDENKQKIVHLGSEGEELYVLAETFVDFLRLLAIGYDEIGYADFEKTVQEWNLALGEAENEGVNPTFQDWVAKEFGVTIPKKGNEIVDTSNTYFSEWIEAQIEKYS